VNTIYKEKKMEDLMKVIGAIVLICVLFVVMPFINFWLAYFGGWIAKLVIGTKLAAALNILFNTTYFTAEMLPMMAGALGWVGSFFKSTTTIKNKN
jgi:hypothetical protein